MRREPNEASVRVGVSDGPGHPPSPARWLHDIAILLVRREGRGQRAPPESGEAPRHALLNRVGGPVQHHADQIEAGCPSSALAVDLI